MGHGRALLGFVKRNAVTTVVEKVIKEGLNVRQLEQFIQQLNDHVPRETKKPVHRKRYFY